MADFAALPGLPAGPDGPGAVRAALATCDLGALLHRVAETEQAHADTKRIVIHRQVPADAILRRSHGPMLEHIVGNFLSNAVKFSAPGTAIFLALEKVENRVTMSVTDQGPGIAGGDRAAIFSGKLRSSGADGRRILAGPWSLPRRPIGAEPRRPRHLRADGGRRDRLCGLPRDPGKRLHLG